MSKQSPTQSADLLVELGTEELPPTALRTLSEAFTHSVCAGLGQARLHWDEKHVASYATPRRLALLISGLETRQADQSIEKLGPAVQAAYDKQGAPSKAAIGFARSNGVDFEALETVTTDKGERLCFKSQQAGKATAELLEGIVQQALGELPIPKRMRWGASRAEFVRPAHWLVILLNDEIVEAEVLGITAGRTSYGHRFHAPGPIEIDHAKNYEADLQRAGVTASFAQRRAMIKKQVTEVASSLKGKAVIEPGLLEEVTALVEKPVALAGAFDHEFLSVPHEALIYSMSEHQKYFHMLDNNGELLPHFITVSNIESSQPAQIVAGNERVIRPRLADAAFFFATDKKLALQSLRERLRPVVFQQKLGTVYEKTGRIAQLAAVIAGKLGADQQVAQLAGELCKADLASDMVLEFDKMQGIAGGYYARHAGLPDAVASAIEQHYLPKFAGDKVPAGAEACAVALADRLDTLSGIFGIGQKPSGSKDPFALRRASIGLLQIILQNRLQLNVAELVDLAVQQHAVITEQTTISQQVVDYIFDRFGAHYQEQGLATEVFQAVRSIDCFDPLDFDARVQAVARFMQQPESESLAAANKRVGNILQKSEGDGSLSAPFDPELLQEDAEETLAGAVAEKEARCAPLFRDGNYRDGLLELTGLRAAVDNFFDHVMVNTNDSRVRNNRLALLRRLRQLFLAVADISMLATGKK